MATIDFQVMSFMLLVILATILVSLSKRRKSRHKPLRRCGSCGRTLDPDVDKEGLCIDCYRIERI